MDFNDLISSYTLPKSCVLIELPVRNTIAISQLQVIPQEDLPNLSSKTVVIDDYQWAASFNQGKANEIIYSCNGDVLCSWQGSKGLFLYYRLIDNKLVTIKRIIFKVKGEKSMEIYENFITQLDQELLDGIPEEETEKAEAFDETASDKEGKSDKNAENINKIKSKLTDVAMADNVDIIVNNQKFGRLLGYVVTTDPVIKLSVKSTPIVDANGKHRLVDDVPTEIQDLYNKKGKCPAKYYVKEHNLEFKQAKPSKIVACVIATPAASDVELSRLSGTDKITRDSNKDNSKVIKMISLDSSYAYISGLYDGRIQEGDNVKNPCWVEVKPRVVNNPEGGSGISATLKLQKNSPRKTILTDGNFFPMKLYHTISTQSLTKEDKEILNLNVKAALQRKDLRLSAASQAKINFDEKTQKYTSDWFDKGEPIEVQKYDNKDEKVMDVRIPFRAEVAKKDGSGYTYKFDYYGLEDTENGPLSKKAYKDFITATGLDESEFVEKVKGLKQKRASSSKKAEISASEYIRAMLSKRVSINGGKSLKEIQLEISGLR